MRNRDSRTSQPYRVLLISVDVRGHYSLATPLLKGYVQTDDIIAANVAVELLSVPLVGRGTRILRSVLAAIFKLRPAVVGFSCHIWNARFIRLCCRWVARCFPRTIIVLGGQEISEPIGEIQELYPEAHVLIPGEGEGPFLDLLKSLLLSGFDHLDQVKGLHFRLPDSPWSWTGIRPRIARLDSIPSPYLSGAAQIPVDPHMGAMIEISRGCPLHCSFCFESERYSDVQTFSMERVAAEFERLLALGYRRFHILDPILSVGHRVARIQEGLARLPLRQSSISAEIYAEFIGAEDARKMDFISVCDVGVQTISPVASRLIGRGFKRERFEAGFHHLKEAGKQINLYLLSGLPGDTLQTFVEGVEYLSRLEPDDLFLNPLLCLRGTPLRRDAARHGLVYNPEPPYLVTACDSFPSEELALARLYAKRRAFGRNARERVPNAANLN